MNSQIRIAFFLFLLCISTPTRSQVNWVETSAIGIPDGQKKGLYSIGNKLFLSLGSQGLYTSEDHSETWNESLIPEFEINDVDGKNSNILVATDGGLYKSTNSGDSWLQISNEAAIHVTYISPNVFLIVTLEGIVKKTKDGGSTFYVTYNENAEYFDEYYDNNIVNKELLFYTYRINNESEEKTYGLVSTDQGETFTLFDVLDHYQFYSGTLYKGLSNVIKYQDYYFRFNQNDEISKTDYSLSGLDWNEIDGEFASPLSRGYMVFSVEDTLLFILKDGSKILQNQPGKISTVWNALDVSSIDPDLLDHSSFIGFNVYDNDFFYLSAADASIFRIPRSIIKKWPQDAIPSSPEDNSVLFDKDVLLEWSSEGSVGNFSLEVSEYPTFDDFDTSREFLLDTTVNTTNFSLTDLELGETYYWRVNALDSDPKSYVSKTYSFTISDEAGGVKIPELLTPADEITNTPLDLTFSWSGSASSILFDFQLISSDNITIPVIDRENITQTKIRLSELEENHTYYWRVRAKNSSDQSDWTSLSKFTTSSYNNELSLISPESGSQIFIQNSTFKWTAVSDAQSYTIEFSTTDDFSSLAESESDITDDFFIPKNTFEEGTVYYWRTAVFSSDGLAGYSKPDSITQASSSGFIPRLLHPVNNIENLSSSVLLLWDTYDEPDLFQLQVYNESRELIIIDTLINKNEFKLTNLEFDSDYSWSVTSKYQNLQSSSILNYFSTTDKLAPVKLVGPKNNADQLPDSITLTWQKVDFAQDYLINVAQFTSPFEEFSYTTSDSFLTINELQLSSGYTWEVRSRVGGIIKDESSQSNIFYTNGIPFEQSLLYPTDNEIIKNDTVRFVWNSTVNTDSYVLQVFTIGTNGEYIVDNSDLVDTTYTVRSLQPHEEYYWRVKPVNENFGEGDWSEVIRFSTEVSTINENENTIPNSVFLHQNYPNPFNPSTSISFGIPHSSYVKLVVFDLLGQEVIKLISKNMSAGWHTVTLDASNLSSGVYFYKLEFDKKILLRKMTFIK